MGLSDSLRKKADNFQKLKSEAPVAVGNMGQNFFRKSFENQGWTDKGLEKWKQVKRRIPGTPAYKYPKKNAADRHRRAILVGIGSSGGPHLRQSVNTSLKVAVFNNILFSVPQVYSRVHNEGLVVKGFRMPKRQFMGHSATLIGMIDKYMKSKLKAL